MLVRQYADNSKGYVDVEVPDPDPEVVAANLAAEQEALELNET